MSKLVIKDNNILKMIAMFVSFTVAIFLTIQLKTVSRSEIDKLEMMRESDVKSEIANLNSKNLELNTKIEETKKISESYEKENEIENQELPIYSELETLKKAMGKTEIEEKGIKITLRDTENSKIDSSELTFLIAKLWSEGAEAISLNEHRIVNESNILLVGKDILISGERIESPYEIKIIGNNEHILSGLNSKNSYVDELLMSGKDVSFEEKDLVIPKSE